AGKAVPRVWQYAHVAAAPSLALRQSCYYFARLVVPRGRKVQETSGPRTAGGRKVQETSGLRTTYCLAISHCSEMDLTSVDSLQQEMDCYSRSAAARRRPMQRQLLRKTQSPVLKKFSSFSKAIKGVDT
ncbi:hypothetical protein HAX54_052753, partial [Datura stramonium]|nr:hypothetical protein [Datura stramonium]